MEQVAINISGLTKHYETFCLKDFSLTVEPGTIAGLVGSNGAGKTTAIKSLFAAYKPDAGSVSVLGKPIVFGKEKHTSLKQDLGFVFDTAPYGTLKVNAIEKIGEANYPAFDKETFRAELAKAKIDVKTAVNKLSRGMSMRLQLAFAFAHHPSVLVLDEPTAGLDPMAKQDVLDEFRTFMEAPGHAILFSTHETQDLEHIADTVTCLDNGCTVFSNTLDELQTDFGYVVLSNDAAKKLIQLLVDNHVLCYSQAHKLNCEVLVTNKSKATASAPDVTFSIPHIDQIMNLMIRGRKHE